MFDANVPRHLLAASASQMCSPQSWSKAGWPLVCNGLRCGWSEAHLWQFDPSEELDCQYMMIGDNQRRGRRPAWFDCMRWRTVSSSPEAIAAESVLDIVEFQRIWRKSRRHDQAEGGKLKKTSIAANRQSHRKLLAQSTWSRNVLGIRHNNHRHDGQVPNVHIR